MPKINIHWRIWHDTFKTLHRPSDMNIIDYKHEFKQLLVQSNKEI